MRIMRNGMNEPTFQVAFENGWTVNVSSLPCGHVFIAVAPTHIAENREFGEKYIREHPEIYNKKTQIKLGNIVEHFRENDDELLDFLIAISCRPTEPHLAKVGQDIIKAVKS